MAIKSWQLNLGKKIMAKIYLIIKLKCLHKLF